MYALKAVLVSTFMLVGCSSTPPAVLTNTRPAILDHPAIVPVSGHIQDTTTAEFFEAVDKGETFGYCLPIGANRSTAPILCFVTEVGEVYVVIDHTLEEHSEARYEIGSAVRKSRTQYFVPLLDVVVNLE